MVDGASFGLAEFDDTTVELPFIDWMKMSRPMWATYPGNEWNQDNIALKATGVLDADGWPTELPPGATGIRFMFTRPADEELDMILLYDGVGTLWHFGTETEPGRVEFTLTGSNRWFDITETDPGNTGDYIRNIRIFRADQESLFDDGEIFNPDFLAVIEGADDIRFMNWMQTNNSIQEEWADRPKLSTASWGSYTATNSLIGVPVEVMVELANRIKSDPWFNMPHQATDEYVEEFATYVRDNLDPDLVANVEFSNETWNWLFSQTGWLQSQANDVWGIAPGGDAWIQFSAKKSVEFAGIWNTVYGYTGKGNPRLNHVMNVQQGWVGLALTQLTAPTWEAEEPGNFIAPNTVIDSIGITSYFGGAHVSTRGFALESVTVASPCVISRAADQGGHGLEANQKVRLFTDGELPTGLQDGVTYYVKTVLTAHTFTVSATPGGGAINTSGTQSGTHFVSCDLRLELEEYMDDHDHEETADWLTDRLLNREDIAATVPNAEAAYAVWRGHADDLEMNLIAYEGGTHEGHSAGIAMSIGERDALTAFYSFYSYSPQITTVYEALRQAWVQYADSAFMQFVDVATPGLYGAWGMRRFLSDLSPRSAWAASVIRKLPPREGYVGVTAKIA